MAKTRKDIEALEYHSIGKPGKIEVVPTKPYSTQRDLSLAYSPGVAVPCMETAANKEDVYKYTAKGNLVAVITNGTAVLGLGDIGPEAAKPVMEGKGLLFKIFADIDVFDIEIDATDVDLFVNTVKAISPTFGGINLEDIKAPECFEIEERLKKELKIPVMHDDQHGTAIITSAALLNAVELAGKKLSEIKLVVNGAGAAAMSCTKLYVTLGVNPKNIIMLDSKGVIRKDNKELSESKKTFATTRKIDTLAEALKDADMFLGLSKGNIVSKAMIKSMAKNPIVFALANPNPEIAYKDAIATRKDIIMATGRSDHPNQVNNVLGFPYIFRGALDVRATCINEEMKLAAVRAVAILAKETVPEEVNEAYNQKNISFGRNFIIPKPLDHRLITTIAPAVAKAAMDSGVAQNPIKDWELYKENLTKRLGLSNKLLKNITERAKVNPKRVVFAEADNYKILKAALLVHEEGIAQPILLGKIVKIQQVAKEFNLDLGNIPIIDPRSSVHRDKKNFYAAMLYEKRKRKGVTLAEAQEMMRSRNYFGSAMVEMGDADAFISGLTRNYKNTITPALQVIGTDDDVSKIAGMYIIFTKEGPFFFADTTVNLDPSARDIADLTVLVAKIVERFKIIPKIALLSYSNFGSAGGEDSIKMREAKKILDKEHPHIVVDGEIQANFALNKELRNEIFPFSELAKKNTNTLIFPNLAAGNIAYKLMLEMGGFDAIGPILLGMKKPVHILQLGSSVREIVNMITLAVADAQTRK